MARLSAQARGLYFRTQDPLAAPLAALLELPDSGVVRLLDPCAGAGIFLERLFEQLPRYSAPPDCTTTLISYGVEPNHERAQAAQHVFTHLLCADFFAIRISRNRFQLALVNPPYDEDLSSAEMAEASYERLELRFLRRTTQVLAPDGILIYLVPQVQLLPAARHLAANYTQLRCWRFPDVAWSAPEDRAADGAPKPPIPLYDQYRQVVLIGARRRAFVSPADTLVKQIHGWALAGRSLPALPTDPAWFTTLPRWPVPADLPDLSDGVGGRRSVRAVIATRKEPVKEPDETNPPEPPQPTRGETLDEPPASVFAQMRSVPPLTPPRTQLEALPPIEFADPSVDLDQFGQRLHATGAGVWADAEYRVQRWPDLARLRLGMERPLGPLRLGHLITLAAVGLLNGRILTGPDGRRLLVKGACHKEVVVAEEREESPGGRAMLTKTETEKFVIALWAIDLATGELIHIV